MSVTTSSTVDGAVANLTAWTVGELVKRGDVLLNLVSLSATTEIDAMVLNKDIGFEAINVSRDANKDDKQGLVYPVRVHLDATDIGVDGKRVAIAPGMAVNCEIITGDRRVIDYVLSPILRYRHESGKQR